MAIAPQQRPWREWYQLEAWRRRRRLQLQQFPLCKLCDDRGIVTIACIADHITPHRGDWNAFRLGAIQSLCAACHSVVKKRLDLFGYDASSIDEDGWPTDPKHPANAANAVDRAGVGGADDRMRRGHAEDAAVPADDESFSADLAEADAEA